MIPPVWLDANGTACDLPPHAFAHQSLALSNARMHKAWTVKKYVVDSIFWLLLAIVTSVLVVLSATAVPKPEKTVGEHEDDQDQHRRGAFGRRPVGASRFRVENRKLEVWHTYAGWLMFVALVGMTYGLFTTMRTMADVMSI